MDKYLETFETWDKIAQLYEDRFMDLDLYNDTYTAFCKVLKKTNASILEIGCGPGNITKFLLDTNPAFKISALDVSKNMVEIARTHNPKADFHIMDCRNINTIQNTFDGVICGFTIPYLSESDCSKMISDLNSLINDNGILYLSFVSGDYKKSGYLSGSKGDRTYFYYHNLQNIKRILDKNDFKTIEVIEKEYKKSDGTSETHTILLSKKQT